MAGTTGIEMLNYLIDGGLSPRDHAAAPVLPLTSACPRRRSRHRAGPLVADHLPRRRKASPTLGSAKDCGRAIALSQLADRLNHRICNVALGSATSNAVVILPS